METAATQLWDSIGTAIRSATGRNGAPEPLGRISGGDINRAVRLRLGPCRYFVKLNEARLGGMFSAEARGLDELRRSRTLRVPEPICHGVHGDTAFLVLESLDLVRDGDAAALGAGLAAMHRSTDRAFGWHQDNTIGATPQINERTEDWVAFWREHRLGFQLRLAERNGYEGRLQARGQELLARCHLFFTDYSPIASLLHGDLWAGNHAYLPDGEPVIFDPAVYFGDRETDLAMTELFGGFGREFYAAYGDHHPLDPGYATRKTLYQLYHVLNHLNLFGGGYLARSLRMVDALLAELG